MLFLKKVLYQFKNLILNNNAIPNPIFIKEFSDNNDLLKDLTDLCENISSYKKDLIIKDIKFLHYGILGEKKVYFHLKNSFIPMLCLHDIRLEYKDFVAQLDFVILTNKYIYILEVKNLYGDIKVTEDGNFIRIIKDDKGNSKKQGMDNPFVQNQRHINIFKSFLKSNGFKLSIPIKSFIIFANTKSLIYKDKAPKNIRQALIKYDQISSIIEGDIKKSDYKAFLNNKELYSLADFLKNNHKKIKYNLKLKYNILPEDYTCNPNLSSIDLKLYKELKKYRYHISKKNNVPPYDVFKDSQLSLLVSLKPKTKKDLITIYGLNDKRIHIYGEELLEIISLWSA